MAAISRPWIAAAAAPASCWYTIARTRAAKWLAWGWGSFIAPPAFTSWARPGSRPDSSAAAAAGVMRVLTPPPYLRRLMHRQWPGGVVKFANPHTRRASRMRPPRLERRGPVTITDSVVQEFPAEEIPA